MKTQCKTKESTNTRKSSKKLPKRIAKRAKPADVIVLPEPGAINGSVVAQHWKAKAGKSGVWRNDKLDDAVRSAFLAAGGTDIDPQEAARIATDAILQENGLDVGRWSGKNAGMLSMNLRNVLRGLLRNDGLIFIRGKKIEA